jgi:hypothetical protein
VTTPTVPKGPRLILRVRRHRHRPLLLVAGQCHSGCKLSVSLLAHKPNRGDVRTRVSTRLTGFSSNRQLVKLRIPRRLAKRVKRGQVVVMAVGRDGGTTTASRAVRLR